jgi:hypothetical protein
VLIVFRHSAACLLLQYSVPGSSGNISLNINMKQ